MLRVTNEESFILGFTKDEKEHTIEIDFCKDPYCNCAIVDLEIRSEKDDPNTESVKIMLDNREQDLMFDLDSNTSPFLRKKANDLIDFLTKGLNEDDWELLYLSSEIIKGNYIEFGEYDLDEWGFTLDEELLKEEEPFVNIIDIFAGIPYISISDGVDEYTLEDIYCKKSDCDCTIVKFNLLKNDKKVEILEYNYATAEMTSSRYNKIISDFLFEYHPFVKKIQHRVNMMKAVYAKAPKSYNSKLKDTIKQKKKVSRNEPCPCGSGEKYKNCCGNNVININRNNN